MYEVQAVYLSKQAVPVYTHVDRWAAQVSAEGESIMLAHEISSHGPVAESFFQQFVPPVVLTTLQAS